MVDELVEREAELESLAGTVEAALGGNGGCAFVEGPAGIGKSSLLGAVSGLGRDRGMQVLAARGGGTRARVPVRNRASAVRAGCGWSR
jgi:ABC-type transport system involved in cytochrome c biogenesis ATPase subunit